MSYYGRSRYENRSNVSSPALKECIDTLSKNTGLTPWEKGFIDSVLKSYEKYKGLTSAQHSTVQKIADKHSAEKKAARGAWQDNWNADMQSKIIFAANYYKANPPYYSDAAERILSDPSYIPSAKLYKKMVDNPFVQRAMKVASEAPKYLAGTMAKVRSNALTGMHRDLRPLRNCLVMIVHVEPVVWNATRGTRKVTILPIGTSKTIATEERYLKKAKV